MTEVRILASSQVTTIDFDGLDHLLRGLRRSDPFIQLAVLAGHHALQQSGIMASCQPEDVGVCVGSTTGPLKTNFDFLDTLFDDGEGQASPTLFSHSVHNAAAGYVSRLLNLQGMSQTVTTNGWPFLAALSDARWSVVSGMLPYCLVLGIEESCPVLDEAAGRLVGKNDRLPQMGAVAWLLSANEQPGLTLAEITIDEQYNDEVYLLSRDREVFSASVELPSYSSGSLASCLSLTTAMERIKSGIGQGNWQVKAPFGSARCEFGKAS